MRTNTLRGASKFNIHFLHFTFKRRVVVLLVLLAPITMGFDQPKSEDDAFTLLLTESFETDGDGSRYQANLFFNVQDLFTRFNLTDFPEGPHQVSGTDYNFFSTYSGHDGNFVLGGEDIDEFPENPLSVGADGGHVYVVFKTLDVSAYRGGTAKAEMLLGANSQEIFRYETDDFIKIEYAFDSDIATGANSAGAVPTTDTNVDDGTYAVAGAFYGDDSDPTDSSGEWVRDTDLDGVSSDESGTKLGNVLTDHEFTFDIPAAATLMSVRFHIAATDGSEEIILDNVRISAEEGVATAPEINVKQSTTSIASGGSHGFGSVQIGDQKDIVFTIENTGDADLDITSLTVSGNGFSLQSGASADPVSASGTASFTVRFQPTATSQTSGSISIGSDDADEGTYTISLTSSVTDATISLKVFLEGPLSGTTMSTTINGSLPTNPSTVYSSAVSEISAGIPVSAVDWVEVEFRTGTASGTKVGTNRAGILKSDGTIVDKDGNNFTMTQADGSSYYIVIHHRNHLSVMSSSAISPSSGTYTFDFTTAQANNYNNGSDGAVQVGSVFAMLAGDADDDGDVDVSDQTVWRGQNGVSFSYSGNGKTDLNLDGVINAVDRNGFQQKNSSKTSQVPST